MQFRHRFDQKCPFTDSLHWLDSHLARTSSVPLEKSSNVAQIVSPFSKGKRNDALQGNLEKKECEILLPFTWSSLQHRIANSPSHIEVSSCYLLVCLICFSLALASLPSPTLEIVFVLLSWRRNFTKFRLIFIHFCTTWNCSKYLKSNGNKESRPFIHFQFDFQCL